MEYLGTVQCLDGVAHGEPLCFVQRRLSQALDQIARLGDHGHDDVGCVAFPGHLLARSHRRWNRKASRDHPAQQAEFAHGAAVAWRAAGVAVRIEARDHAAAPVVAQHHIPSVDRQALGLATATARGQQLGFAAWWVKGGSCVFERANSAVLHQTVVSPLCSSSMGWSC